MAISDRAVRQEFLERQPTYWLKRSYQALRRLVDSELRPLGVTLSQRDALLTLYHGGPTALGELADHLGLEQSSVSRLALGLQRRGLVDIRSDDTDKRSRRVSITGPGSDLVRATPGASRIATSALAGALSEAEAEQLVELLRKFALALEGHSTRTPTQRFSSQISLAKEIS